MRATESVLALLDREELNHNVGCLKKKVPVLISELVCTKQDKNNTKQTKFKKNNQKKNSFNLNSPLRGKLCCLKLMLTGNSDSFLSNTKFRNVTGCSFKIQSF